jgi:hypothetical protein
LVLLLKRLEAFHRWRLHKSLSRALSENSFNVQFDIEHSAFRRNFKRGGHRFGLITLY